jgi:putative beta-lysine N-acetyltransferase
MIDGLENVYGSKVQHGPHNDRIYVLHLAPGEPDSLIFKLDEIACQRGYGKIFAKIPETCWQDFSSAGYVKEVEIPGFFHGNTACYFVSKFFNNRQETSENFSELYRLSRKDFSKSVDYFSKEKCNIERCSTANAEELSLVYQQVFRSYPFPISDPSYLSQSMDEGVRYYCIRRGDGIVAAAAIESDFHGQNAEMTDFATLPKWQGNGFAESLLRYMDAIIEGTDGIKTVYTIARATSYGINSVFRKCGYIFAGLLVNNTQISGGIRSMAVWYKHV